MFQKIQILLFMTLMLSGKISFADECSKGEYWVNPHFRNSYIKYDGTVVRATTVRGYCRANPRGYEKWHQKLSNERPGFWGYKSEKSKKWTTEEVERVYEALSSFPDQLLSLNKVEIYRMGRSKADGNPATSNGNDVVLYDSAFKHKIPTERILAHELSHPLYYTLNPNQREDFARSARWKKIENTKAWVARKDKVYFEEDSRVSLVEDFANHIEYYLFKNEFLKESAPEAFKWINQTFGKDFKLQEKR